MSAAQEFHYRLPRRFGGWRPGSHPASSLGAGQEFVAHASLYRRPDPRRLDLRASLRDVGGDWLVRVHRQRAAVSVLAIVDVSASMSFGSPRSKLQVVADFMEALGPSAFRVGDTLGMSAFDETERMDLFVPPMLNRGAGSLMASLLRACRTHGRSVAGLDDVTRRYAGRPALIFLASDFHWPTEQLGRRLDQLAHAYVVPLVVWHPTELEPPAHPGLLSLRDVESRSQQTFWMRSKLRTTWREAVEARRAELDGLFARHALRPFYMTDAFDSEAMSRYFLEAAA